MVRYRLDDLGWFQFEWLCQALLKATLGLAVESWGGHSDLGRDAFATQPLRLNGDETEVPGPTVFQAKFVENANAAGAKPWENLRKAVVGEIKSIETRRSKKNVPLPLNLVLLTNAPVTAGNRAELAGLIRASFPETTPFIWAADDLCAMLDNAPNIRVSFPQLLSIRDIKDLLASVADRGINARSTLVTSRARELAAVFVPTRSYNRTLAVLHQHSFAVLTGPPEVGKTTIARLIGLAKMGEGWECFECKTPEEVLLKHSFTNPQIFIADDAFGTTDFQPEIAHMWSSDLDSVLRLLDSRHWLIWTSRPALLKVALSRMHLQGRAENFPKPAEILVDAAKLSRNERALILYRHSKNANLDAAAKSVIRHHASLVVGNSHFTPERAYRFVTRELPELVRSNATEKEIGAAIGAAIEEPTNSMKKSFDALGEGHQTVLISMLDASSSSVARKELAASIERHSGGTSSENHINDLCSHFLRSSHDHADETVWLENEEPVISWMHPSWRDLVIDQLANNTARRRTFLAHCGLSGFKLALSIAGGASGTRSKPLLRDEEDWVALHEGLPALVSANANNHFSLLKSVETALESEKKSKRATSSLKDLATACLELVRVQWSQSVVVPHSLKSYYLVSEFLSPLPPGPDLAGTWTVALERAEGDLESFSEWNTEFNLTWLIDWLEFAEIIQNNEPRFLRQVGFPDDYDRFSRQIIDKISARIETLPDLETEEDCSEEESRMDSIHNIASMLATLFPGLEEVAEKIKTDAEISEIKAREVRSGLEAEARRAEADDNATSDSSPPDREYTAMELPLDIDLLFADL